MPFIPFFSFSLGSIRDGLYITQSHARQRRRRLFRERERERGGRKATAVPIASSSSITRNPIFWRAVDDRHQLLLFRYHLSSFTFLSSRLFFCLFILRKRLFLYLIRDRTEHPNVCRGWKKEKRGATSCRDKYNGRQATPRQAVARLLPPLLLHPRSLRTRSIRHIKKWQEKKNKKENYSQSQQGNNK
jgi:hypothetical protein